MQPRSERPPWLTNAKRQKHSMSMQVGSWCSGITSASHAEGPEFKSQWVHFLFSSGTQRAYDALVWPCANRIVCIPRTIGCKHCARACSRRRTKHASCGTAAIAQLGERQTEDLKVPGSIPGLGIIFVCRRITASRGCKSRCLALTSLNICDASLLLAVNGENH